MENNNKIENIESLVDDLEAVNSDFKKEIEEEKKKNEPQKKEEEKEEELDLKPLVDNNQLQDIMELNPDNVGDFLKKNGKEDINNKKKEEKKKDEDISKTKTNIQINILDNFELNKDLWNELNLDEEILEKIKCRVKNEIKLFIKDNLISYLEEITK